MKKELPSILTITEMPILKSSVDELSRAVHAKIEGLNLDAIEATEDNKKLLKELRADLNKEIGAFEKQRVEIKRFLLRDYNEFETEYKNKIKAPYDDADKKLKAAIDVIQAAQDQEIKDYAVQYFNELKAATGLNEPQFNNIKVNYTNAKQVRVSIDAYFENIKKELDIINTHAEYRDRLYAIWVRTGYKVVNALTILNDELALEARVAKERAQIEAPTPEIEETIEIAAPDPEDIIEVSEVMSFKLTVNCTEEELAELLEYMMEKNIDYDFQ